MEVLKQAGDSQFVFVIVASRRARQLMAGAPPLLGNPRSHKATRIAQEELEKGLLEFQLPETPGEDEKESKRRKG